MKFSNSIELEIRGERALFRDPLRPQTLPVPSCEALKGILVSIYWNPDFIWVPDSLRVMEPIGYTREGARTSDGSRFTNADVHCLKDVRYQLRAHFVWNEQRPGSVKLTERDEIKHFRIALRSLARGGRRWVCLGRADCPAAVRSVHFGGVHSQEAPERACRAGSADSDLPAGAPRRRPRTAALRAPGELRYSGGGMPALVRRPRVRAGVFLQGNARAGR